MSYNFSDYEISLINSNRLPYYYPDGKSLEKYLLADAKTGNLDFTLALFTTDNGKFVLPITSRTYRGILVHQLYHSEFFKNQYSMITGISHIQDLRNKSIIWEPKYNMNSRVVLRLNCSNVDNILGAKSSIKRYLKKYPLEISNTADENLITATIDRFNIANLGATSSEYIERDMYLTGMDTSRRYFSLSNRSGEHKAIVELQVDTQNSVPTIYWVNSYYLKTQENKDQRVGLNSYYTVVRLAAIVAKELGYSNIDIDFGIIFKFHYKLKIPGSFLAGHTMTFIKNNSI